LFLNVRDTRCQPFSVPYSEQAGGQKALDLIEFKKDPAVIAICKTWAGDYDAKGPLSLGFAVDDRQKGYAEAVADFQKGLKA
jgi:hypothetical protein